MQRFLLFGGRDYYPQGGFNDFIGSSSDLETAKHSAHTIPEKFGEFNGLWAHIVDTETSKIVAAFENQPIPHPIDGYTGKYEFVEYKVVESEVQSCTE